MHTSSILVIIVAVALIAGCLNPDNNNEQVPPFFKTDVFTVGDKLTYELWGKMTVLSDEGAFYSYLDLGEATVEIKEGSIEDGAGNEVNVIDFHMQSDETPSNHTKEVKEGLPIEMEKHVYRLRGTGIAGGIIKSFTVQHAINRENEFTMNAQPTSDIIDEFLQKEYNGTMNGSFTYQGMPFTWQGKYDKSMKAYCITLTTDADNITTVQIWIKNDYPLPFQITFKQDDGATLNKYTYTLKKFSKGSGASFALGNVNYEATRDVTYYAWKGFGAPLQGSGGSIKLSMQTAMADALASNTPYYSEFRAFRSENPGTYMNFAEYWHTSAEAGWNLYFSNRTTTYPYILNTSNTGRTPIPTTDELNYYYIPYPEIPKEINNISDTLISISEAENIFSAYTEWGDANDSFRVSFIEQYYPDTLFDVWEGNGKEKGTGDYLDSRSAALVDGFHVPVRDYVFGYWLVIPHGSPFEPSEYKINGADGVVTYTYEGY